MPTSDICVIIAYTRICNFEQSGHNVDSDQLAFQKRAPMGFGDLGRMAIYFQGSMEHWLLF